MLLWIQRHIEYPAGVFGAVISGAGVGAITNAVIGVTASVIGGTIMVFITHFVKLYLQKKYPLKK